MPDFRGTKVFDRERVAFEAGMLPDSEKERLCRALLAEFGVTSIKVTHEGEMIHSCCLPTGGHKNGDLNASASLNYRKLTYNPVAGETLVKTFDGERPIRDLAGGRHRLLDGAGRWVESEVIHSGVHPLFKVTLTRNGRERVVYATAEHRWLIAPKGSYQRGRDRGLVERTTATLTPRDRIPSVWATKTTGKLVVSPFGVARGFVYGDGTQSRWGSIANFIGEKDEALLEFFPQALVRDSAVGKQVRQGLPRSWKVALPALDEGPSYLYGWLAGYFAADGCVADDGHVTLSSASEASLRHVMAICERLGIATWGLTSAERQGYGSRSILHTLSFRGSTLTREFFLLPQHRQRWEAAQARRRYERTHWWVKSIEPTDRVEEVFCAIVPTTHSFVLEGNILTGNCFGCGSSGGLLWFIALCRGEDTEDSRRWLADQTGTGPDEQSLSSLLEFFEAVYAGPQHIQAAPIPKMSPTVLQPWAVMHPYMFDPQPEGRGVPEDTLIRFQVGYAEAYRLKIKATPERMHEADDQGNISITSPRIVIPHFWKGNLVGWQTRRLIADGSPKYQSSPDFPKDQTLYNYDPKRRTALIVESPLSVLRHWHHVPELEGTFGAKMTDRQCALISIHARVVSWLDNDKAGWQATERLGRYLEAYSDHWVVECPWNADPADLPDEEVDRLYHEALVPFSLWKPPTVLYCWHCRNVAHEGEC